MKRKLKLKNDNKAKKAILVPKQLPSSRRRVVVARPLNALFRVAQYFSLSWQLEILSEQAKSLAKGNWGSNQNNQSNYNSNSNSNSSNSNSGESYGAYQGRSGPPNGVNNKSSITNSNIVVTPVQFFDNRPNSKILGIMSISFWTVDDRYGPPSMSDLYNDEEFVENDENDEDEGKKNSNNNNKRSSTIPSSTTTAGGAGGTGASSVAAGDDSVSTVSRSVHNNPTVTNRFTLSIRAEIDVGIKVSLSGADSIVNHSNNNNNNNDSNHNHVRSTIQDLLEATSNPFALSASEALLAATLLCAERKCYAMVNALLTSTSGGSSTRSSILPSWITLKVEKGSIIVAANIQYYTAEDDTSPGDDGKGDDDANLLLSTSATSSSSSSSSSKKPVVLFRLACDSRTGSFVPIFSRSTPLLQYMACNDVPRAASDTTLLRIATLAKNNKHRSSSSRNQAAIFNSGRIVRDSFDSLCRSMNVLGQRTGVGIHSWNDSDENNSPSLRKRAIGLACKDVKVSLMTCCGMSVLYGLSIVSLNVASGIDSSPEMSGGKLDLIKEIDIKMMTTVVDANNNNNKNKIVLSSFLTAPPPSLLLDSKLVEHTSWTTDISGERIKHSIAEQERFGICCSIIDDDNDTGNENDKTDGRGGGGLIVYGANIKVELEQSPSSIPIRKSINFVPFIIDDDDDMDDDKQKDDRKQQEEEQQEEGRPTKRIKTDTTGGGGSGTTNNASSTAVVETRDLIDEVEYFASIIADTIGI